MGSPSVRPTSDTSDACTEQSKRRNVDRSSARETKEGFTGTRARARVPKPQVAASESTSPAQSIENPRRGALEHRSGHYERGAVLGEGAMGVVYLARDLDTGCEVAIKRLLNVDGRAILRLKREFRSLADISHPNLVKLYELGRAEDGWFIAMEYVAGKTLMEHLGVVTKDVSSDRMTSVPHVGATMNELISTFRQLARGIQALHGAGMLHRDLKPSNVMVSAGRVVVLDFGLVRDLSEQPGALTEEGSAAGTPAYMAPEQTHPGDLSEQCDWYAYGVMLFEALTGTLPFDGGVFDLVIAKREQVAPRPRDRNPSVPAHLDELCSALLARNPQERPDAADVLAILDPDASHQSEDHTQTDTATYQTDLRSHKNANPFFGRVEEADQLWNALERVEGGEPAVVHLSGISGSGKSALVEHFLERVESAVRPGEVDNVLVLRGCCYEREAMPFKALDSVIDALARHLVTLPDVVVSHLLPTGIDALSRLFPVLQRLRAVQHLLSIRPHDGNESSDRLRAEAALRELFARLSDRNDVVIWVDDLQWGDLDSARILKDWMAEGRELPIMLLLSYRSDEVATSECLRFLLGADVGEQPGEHIRLRALDEENLGSLCVGRMGPWAESQGQLVAQIVREADGSPFLAEQLTTLARAKLQQGETDFDVSVGNLVALTSAMLPEGAGRLLDILAVAGGPIRLRLALRAADIGKGGREHVHTLRRLQLVRSRTIAGDRYLEVYHDRIREHVVSSLSTPDSQRVHGALLQALEYHERSDPGLLHTLALAAGERVAALRYGLVAADRATSALAFEHAAGLYACCLDLAGHRCAPMDAISTSDDRRSQRTKMILRKLADALAWCGRGASAAEMYLRAAELADAGEALQLRRFATSHFLRSGRFEEGEALLRALLNDTGMGLPETEGRLMAALVWERGRLALRGLGYKKRSAAETPAALLERIDLVAALRHELMLIDPLRAALLLMRQARWALDAGEPRRIMEALCGLCSVASATGTDRGLQRAEALLVHIDELAEEVDSPSARGLAMAARALVYWTVGRSQDAIGPAQEAERLYRLPEASQTYGGYYISLGVTSIRIGAHYYLAEFRASEAILQAALREVNATDNRAARLYLSPNEVNYLLTYDRGDEALAQLRQQRAQLPKNGFGMYHALHITSVCFAACATGRHEWGLACLQEDWPRFLKSPIRHAAFIRVLVHGARIQLLLNQHVAMHRKGRSLPVAKLKVEIDSLDKSPLRGVAGSFAKLARARLALLAGDRPAAHKHLERSHSLADRQLDRERAKYAIGVLLGGQDGLKMQQSAVQYLSDQGLPDPRVYLRSYLPEFQQ